jgi:hypothetical protein
MSVILETGHQCPESLIREEICRLDRIAAERRGLRFQQIYSYNEHF